MCAIIGCLGKRLPSEQQFKESRDTMVHRGPDDEGSYYARKEGIALGHRRLSIIDLAQRGRQPFFSNDKRYCVVFNGEIYNYKELKKELQDFYDFKTNTDTEVLLASFLKWKEKSLQKLNGMFAFAIWDRKKRELFVVRDRLGVKPLYYSFYNGIFYFASEIKGILCASRIPRKLNKASFLDYLSYRYPLGEKTFFENISSLSPGNYMIIKDGKLQTQKQYWELPIVQKKGDCSEEEAIEKTHDLLKRSIAYRMRSDVPTGAYLSGGLDSSLITALMAKNSNKPLKTFSVGFKEKGFNEFEYARIVSGLFNTKHHEMLLSSDEYLDAVPEVIRTKDAPPAVPFEVSGHLLSKKLKEHITVILAGEGADELFGGYGRIFRSASDFDRMQNAGGYYSEERKIFEKNMKEKYGNIHSKTLLGHFLRQYSYLELNEKKGILNKNIFSKDDEALLNKTFFETIFQKTKNLSPTEQYMYVFEKVHLLGLLHRLDTSSMSFSVEAREPYLDHELIEYVSSLPLSLKLRWRSSSHKRDSRLLNSDQISEKYDSSKYLLREIGKKYLPPEITERPKLGPPAPLDDWFEGVHRKQAYDLLLSPQARTGGLYDRESLREMLENSLTPSSKKGLNIWMLVNMELWMHEYNVTL